MGFFNKIGRERPSSGRPEKDLCPRFGGHSIVGAKSPSPRFPDVARRRASEIDALI
jgi:hypothetical protein